MIQITTHILGAIKTMRVYNYIYYKLLVFFAQLNPNMAGFIAMMAMCWLFLINSFAIFGLILIKNPELSHGYSKITGIIFSLSIVLIHSLYFNRKRSFTILKKYRREGMTQNIIGSVAVILYVLISFYVLFYITVPNISGIASLK